MVTIFVQRFATYFKPKFCTALTFNILTIFVLLKLTQGHLHAANADVTCPINDLTSFKNDTQPHQFSICPEVYHLQRVRSGGTKQDGTLYGIRAGYDFIKRYNFSIGIQGFYGNGTLKGKTSQEMSIRSHWTDKEIEGYLGYTFQMKHACRLSFTPFGGYGYFCETNQFISPSPIKLKFTTTFDYFLYGFLSSIMINPSIKIGLNARFRTPWDQKCKVSKDPEHDNITQHIGSGFQFRIELPIRYHTSWLCNHFEIGLMPFYEQRQYNGRISYPFSYLKTQIKAYGCNLQLVFQF